MFPSDSRDYSRKRKFIEVGNTSTDPFGFNVDVDVDAFHGRAPNTTLYPTDNVIKNLDDDEDDDDDDYVDDYEDEKDENLDVFLKKCKGQVVPLDSFMESDHKMNITHTLRNETEGMWSKAIIQAAEKEEEKDAQMQKLSRDLYNMTKELVSCQLENIVLEKINKKAVEKFKSLRKTVKKVLSRRLLRTRHVISRRGGGQEDEGEFSFVETQRHEVTWLACKVCHARMANMIICPCKHLSVCRKCDERINKCPICMATKISSVEVCLP